MTELAVYEPQNTLTEQMEYARAVSVATMLPDNYRGKPADIMLAVGLGSSMGLSPAESLYRISVIKGKPTASAELVAANVRKAGHRLRVMVEPGKATATIVRADDPDFEFTVVRDSAWAQQMGLANNENYRKQGDTMLSWRAITAAARLACPEALYGVSYTPDEMGDGPSLSSVETPAPAGDRMAKILHVEQEPIEDPGEGLDDLHETITAAQLKKIGAAMGELKMTDRATAIAYVVDVIGREVTSRNDLSKAEASAVIEALEDEISQSPDTETPDPRTDPATDKAAGK